MKKLALFWILALLAGCNLNAPNDNDAVVPNSPAAPTQDAAPSQNTPPPGATPALPATPRPPIALTDLNNENELEPIVETLGTPFGDNEVFPVFYPFDQRATLQQGQTLIVNYNTDMTNPTGRVFLVVRDSAGNDIYREVITEEGAGSAEVTVGASGDYRILAATEGNVANFNFTYDIR
ncbi:MAG: hypothetical protein SF029_13670 [bacterium]|nr:hypothetical protein [bacterium]